MIDAAHAEPDAAAAAAAIEVLDRFLAALNAGARRRCWRRCISRITGSPE
jgi:hypothetical protein